MGLSERIDLAMNQATNRVRRLPVLVLSPHSRCNCRCVMCDIWRANANGIEMTVDDLAPHIESFTRLNVEMVVLTGGEALMHRNLWSLCDSLRVTGARLVLLSTGLLLKKHAVQVTDNCDEVIVSLDGSSDIHDKIRNVPRAYERLAEGVEALLSLNPEFDVHGRCVLQRENFRDFLNIIAAARDLNLKRISFLGADVSSSAFNRPDSWDSDRVDEIALSSIEANALDEMIQENGKMLSDLHQSGFLVESVHKLSSIAAYYRALNGDDSFPAVKCNAPWVSAVIDTDGAIRPCFFHPAYGNLQQGNFAATLNSPAALSFRRDLDVQSNPICQKCTCSLNL